MASHVLLCDAFPTFAEIQANRRVGIIGAGFGGLACAYELRSAGYDVQVFEARERLGGRVHSLSDFIPGNVVEAGAELIGENHRYWLKYAERFQLKMEGLDVPGEPEATATIGLKDKLFRGEDLKLLEEEIEKGHAALAEASRLVNWEAPWETPDARELDEKTVAQWIQELPISDSAKLAIETELTHDMAVDSLKMNYLALLCCIKAHGAEQYWDKSENYRCAGGNQQLALRFAEAIGPKRIHLGCPITAITQAAGEIHVLDKQGQTHAFQDVVLAVPPSVWGRIQIEPALPANLNPQMGSAVKSLSQVKQRYWRPDLSADSMSDTSLGMTWEDPLPSGKEAALISFSGGPYADAAHAMTETARETEYSKTLEKILPGYGENRIRRRFVDWISEEWTKCGYSFPLPGSFWNKPDNSRTVSAVSILLANTSALASWVTWKAPCIRALHLPCASRNATAF
jgi:monoamine oxidase